MRTALLLGIGCVTACGGGGAGDDAPPVDAPVYPGTWRTAPSVPGVTQETAVVALDGRIYLIGGFGSSATSVLVFDTATEEWSTSVPLPMPIHHANAAVVGDTIYLLGFLVMDGFFARSDALALTPGVDTSWRTVAPAPAAVGAAAVGVVDGIVYVVGGQRQGVALATAYAYDPVADAWDDALPELVFPVDHACGAGIGGTMYVVGGREGGALRQSLFALEPGGAWVARARLPTARAGIACGVVDGRLVVVGGEGEGPPNGVFEEAEIYDPATDEWSSLMPMPTPRHGMGGAGVGDSFYVPGGANRAGFAAVATHEVLTP